MTHPRRPACCALLVLAAVLSAGCTAGSSPPAEATEEHPLPGLPELGSVLLPPGFTTYETNQYEFSSTHPVHVDTGFFGIDISNDTGTDERCRAQITVSPYYADLATPQPYVEELGTKLCDADWFTTQDRPWHQDTVDPDLWTIETTAQSVGWFSTSEEPAVGVVVVDGERGVVVGLWTEADVYRPDEAVAVARQVAESVG